MATETKAQPAKARSDRVVVALSETAGKHLDALIRRAETRTREALGYSVSPSRADLVASLLKEAHDRENGSDAAASSPTK